MKLRPLPAVRRVFRRGTEERQISPDAAKPAPPTRGATRDIKRGERQAGRDAKQEERQTQRAERKIERMSRQLEEISPESQITQKPVESGEIPVTTIALGVAGVAGAGILLWLLFR